MVLSTPPYDKNWAAVNQYSKLLSFGFPKRSTSPRSLEISIISSTGPSSNGAAIAPILGGLIYDLFETYRVSFAVGCLLVFLAIPLILSLKNEWYKR